MSSMEHNKMSVKFAGIILRPTRTACSECMRNARAGSNPAVRVLSHSGAIYNIHPRPRRDGGREALVTDDGRRRFVHKTSDTRRDMVKPCKKMHIVVCAMTILMMSSY
jgi:hypothetical protein